MSQKWSKTSKIKFLSLILLNHPKSTKFNNLGDLFEFNLAYETKIKKINIAIEKTNLLFKKALLTKSNIVIVEKNKEDGRIKEIRLSLDANKISSEDIKNSISTPVFFFLKLMKRKC